MTEETEATEAVLKGAMEGEPRVVTKGVRKVSNEARFNAVADCS